MTESLSFGRALISPKLILESDVTGGGAHGPGRVARYTDYNSTVGQAWSEDRRSGSKRSGSCRWQLEADQLYHLTGVADGSRSDRDYAICTDGGVARLLSKDELVAERKRRWPMGHQLAVEAAEKRKRDEEERMRVDAERAEARRLEQEALAEMNAERAAEIAALGQPVEEGMPELTGSPKQIAYALTIRKAYAAKHPDDTRAIKTATTAKYWIENHRSVLFR